MLLFITGIIIITLIGCNSEKQEKWEGLFNGKNLENRDKYMDSSLSNKKGITTKDLFSVTEKDGINVISISGEVNASLATKKSYENYHLRLVIRFPDEQTRCVFKGMNGSCNRHLCILRQMDQDNPRRGLG
ncbi:MAG: hypothetical protein ACOCXD_03475 [Bacteroidota bacterium]